MKQYLKTGNFVKVFIFISLVLLSGQGFAQNGAVKGSISDQTNNEAIPFATVSTKNSDIVATTNDKGVFELRNIPPGICRLQVQVMGYKSRLTEAIKIRPNKTTYIDIQLEKETYNINQVIVKSSPFKQKAESPVSLRSLGVSEIEKTPGAVRDIARVIQTLPGVASGSSSFRNDLLVRGGGPSENTFYIDGVEIPLLNHFSTQGASGGQISIVNADFVSQLDFHSGAFPAYAGEALSSVLSFKMLDGNQEKFKYKATIGASDLAFTIDGPIRKNTTVIFSIRRSYLKLLFQLLRLPFLPIYNDFQLKTKTKFNRKNELSIISLGALDRFQINTGMTNPDELQQHMINTLPVINQTNYVIGAVYKRYVKNGYSRLIASRNFFNNNIIKDKSYKTADGDMQTDIISYETENKVRFEQTIHAEGFKISFGAGYEYAKYTNDLYDKMLRLGQDTTLDTSSVILYLNSWSVFGQISRGFFNDKLKLSAGMRADANDYSNCMNNLFKQISPRFSLSFSISDNWFINGNVGKYHKRPEYPVLGYKNEAGVFINKANKLKYIASEQYVAGLEWHPVKSAKLTGEFFYKSYNDYPVSVENGIALINKGTNYGISGNEEVVSTGEGRAYGFEFFARMPSFYDFNMILSYTYVRSEFKNLDRIFIPTKWDNHNILIFTLMKRFKQHWNVGIKWRYVGGSPYTPYNLEKSKLISSWDTQNAAFLDYTQLNSLRLKDLHILDLRIDKTFYFNKTEFGIYIDIQNVYDANIDTPPYLTNLNKAGKPNINPDKPDEYILRKIDSRAGTIIPSLGIKLAF